MTPSPDMRIADYLRLTSVQKDALKKLGLGTLMDLLRHFPVRYGDTAETRNISSLNKGDSAVIYGRITGLRASKGFKTKITMASARIEDESGSIGCVWFNQPYIAKMIADGALVRVEGKVSQKRSQKAVSDTEEADKTPGALYLSNPKIEPVDKLPTGVGDSLFASPDGTPAHSLDPVYPESRGITSLWIYHAVQKIFKSGMLDLIEDPIPQHILDTYHLPGIRTALIWMHAPQKVEDASAARKRFSFEEIFTIQLTRQHARREYEQHPTFVIEPRTDDVREFMRRFPFKATDGQMKAVETILSDMASGRPMSRLLEGDVGSGKTAVAATVAYAVMTAKGGAEKSFSAEATDAARRRGPLQIAYMCPTEILATQHFESFIRYFSYMPIQIGLVTGSGCRKFPSKVNPKGWTDISRSQLLSWVADGSISVLIGTQAIIQKSVSFKNLALAIIDEQHRFGIGQRRKLVQKNRDTGRRMPSKTSGSPETKVPAPHLLSMTATPIPRTLALTLYGDLDLTVLDQLPEGRKPVMTELVLPDGREAVYDKMRHEIRTGRQAYVICPRVNEPDPDKEAAVIAKSVTEEAKRLQRDIFPDLAVEAIHGKMRPAEKDAVMKRFEQGYTHILCATSVIEVGVNVPNATMILIEGAERFGLAQLHQLRGRVVRSSHQAYCFAFTESSSAKSIERLKAFRDAPNGFVLAEMDLAQRGAGELSGLRQWGISDVAMEALRNIKMVEAARTEARNILAADPTLASYPRLKNTLDASVRETHLE